MAFTSNGTIHFLCGTRRVIRLKPGNYRVVCATCGEGGSVHHQELTSATKAAVRDSGKPCKHCGAQ